MKPFYLSLLITGLLVATTARVAAQCAPSDVCGNAGCLFDTTSFANYSGNNAGFTAGFAPNFCGSLETDMWFPFVPALSQVSFTLNPTNCVNGDGLQAALYPSCDLPYIACNLGAQDGDTTPITLTAAVTPGQVYYLMVDGYAGDQCDFTIEYAGGTGQAWQLDAMVVIDENSNCQADPGEPVVPDLPVQLAGGASLQLQPTNADGVTRFYYIATDTYEVSLPLLTQNLLWTACEETFTIVPPANPNADTVVFLLQPQVNCPQTDVQLAFPALLRPCWNYQLAVQYSNTGTDTAVDAQVRLLLPDVLSVLLTQPAPIAQAGDTLIFAVGDLAAFGSGVIHLTVQMTCDQDSVGQTFCAEASITPDDPCIVNSNWSGAQVTVQADCLGDTLLRFTIENTGTAPMAEIREYIIIEDEVILRTGSFQLDPGDTMRIDQQANGQTWRLEAQQEPYYPGFDLPILSAEGCGGLTPGLINAFQLNDLDPVVDVECAEFVASYDPNLKAASPSGVGADRLLRSNTPLDYQIQFENTGNDTAFLVVLVDTLPATLNLSTFTPTGASHPHTWRIDGQRLEVRFPNIQLPYTAVDSVGSHGYFSFRIDQLPDLPDGTYLSNTAAIYFDLNAPVITEPAWHTIGAPATVDTEEAPAPTRHPGWRVLSNPDSWYFLADGHLPLETRLELRDASGRLVHTATFGTTGHRLSAAGLGNGVYFVQLRSDNGVVFGGRIIKAAGN